MAASYFIHHKLYDFPQNTLTLDFETQLGLLAQAIKL